MEDAVTTVMDRYSFGRSRKLPEENAIAAETANIRHEAYGQEAVEVAVAHWCHPIPDDSRS